MGIFVSYHCKLSTAMQEGDRNTYRFKRVPCGVDEEETTMDPRVWDITISHCRQFLS